MKKITKKALLLGIGLVFLIGCSTDSDTSSEIDSLDLSTIISPGTAAAAEFDTSSSGLYKGVFVSDDISYHGVLTINLGNDSQYNAILEYGDNQNQRMGFVRVNNSPAIISNVIEFRGKNAGFTLDVSDYTQPVVTEGYIDGQGVQINLLKETSTHPVRAQLGTFIHDNDPNVNGTWDMMSQNSRDIVIPINVQPFTTIISVAVLNRLVVNYKGSTEFDDVHNDFTPGVTCIALIPTLPPIAQSPFFTGPQNIPGLGFIDDYAAGDQTSFLFGRSVFWNLIYSEVNNTYYNSNCDVLASGRYLWGSQPGSIFID